MSNNKQSSVEWLVEQIKKDINLRLRGFDIDKALEQAKAMHKSEIIWAHGIKMKGVNNHKCVSGEQYYNETFGDNNEKL